VRVKLTALFFIIFILFLYSAPAQSPSATVSGVVLDPSGGVIVGAEVLVINEATGVQYPGRANSEGYYVVPNIPPGTYRIQVSNTGFKTMIKPDIVIHIQDALAINFTLPIGAASELVTVTGGAPLVNTENAAVGTVIDRQFVENLPLNGRSFNTLLQLTPGVVIAAAPLGVASSPGQFSIGGQRTNANAFSVDGVSANFGVVASSNPGSSGTGSQQAFSALGSTSSLVSVDDLREFRVETSSFAPEFGKSPGGQVILTTRSGGNDAHGGAFEYFRNNVLDANNWFANQASEPRAAERHNDFGGFLGGPLVKDKTFFFFSYEGARLRVPQTDAVQVPSEYARSIAPTDLAPYLDTLPKPDDQSVVPGIYTSIFASNFSSSATLNATSIRIDHNFTDNISIFGRYNYAPSQTINRQGFINDLDTVPANTQTLTLGNNILFGPDTANSLRGNYSTQTAASSYKLDSFGGATPIDPSRLLGSISPSGSLGFLQMEGTGLYVGLGSRNRTRQVNLVDDLSLTKGTHQLKLGADYRAIFFDRIPSQYGMNFSVSTVEGFLTSPTAGMADLGTGNSLASKILSQSLSLYAQDTWRATSRLTFTYGLRWELAPAPSAHGTTTLASWVNTSNLAETTLAPKGTPVWATTYANFAPRVGMAYSFGEAKDLVLRAGFGVFYDVSAGQVGTVAAEYPNNSFGPPSGVSGTVTLPVPDLTPFLPAPISLVPPYPTAYGFAQDLKLPRSYQWNVALEKAFGREQALTVTYVGQAGRDLLRNEASFQPNANFSEFFSLTRNSAWSNYEALQVQFRRPLSGRLQALLNYTFSHSLDNVSDDGLQTASHSVISGAADYGNSSFDVRHSFSGAVTFAVPSAAKSGVVSALSRDWFLDGVVVARTGFPFNAIEILGAGPGGIAISRPDLVPGQPIWISDASAGGGKSLNPAAFAFAPVGQQGTEGRNNIAGFALIQADLSLARKFPLTNRLNLQFRADAFNVLNHPNFANPLGLYFGPSLTIYLKSTHMLNSGLGGLNPLFQEGGPRSLQLSLRLTF
jgi:hypothetical protein